MTITIEQARHMIRAGADAVRNPHVEVVQFKLFDAMCGVFGTDEFGRHMEVVRRHLERQEGEPRDASLLDTPIGAGTLLMMAVFAAGSNTPGIGTGTLIGAMTNFVGALAENSDMPTMDFLKRVDEAAFIAADKLLKEGAPAHEQLH